MQMTEMAPPLSGALSSQVDWDSIDWTQIARMVKRLQRRIAKAAKDQKWGKVKSLQWLLTHSRSAKLLAVKTAGVDGVVWLTTEQKLACVETLNRRGYRPKPLRQIYIPKSNG
jgi:RNA-directed DNA polymerase